MSAAKHTPGPLVRWKGFDANGYVVNESTGSAASVRSSAPDLLAALEAITNACEDNDQWPTFTEQARAAIARARGQS